MLKRFFQLHWSVKWVLVYQIVTWLDNCYRRYNYIRWSQLLKAGPRIGSGPIGIVLVRLLHLLLVLNNPDILNMVNGGYNIVGATLTSTTLKTNAPSGNGGKVERNLIVLNFWYDFVDICILVSNNFYFLLCMQNMAML